MLIDLYGLIVQCSTSSPDLAAQLVRPFQYFIINSAQDVTPTLDIVVKEIAPPYETFPAARASFSSPRNIVYQDQGLKIIDYFGQGVVVEDKERSRLTLYGQDRNFLQEAFYLMVMSFFGQHCDRAGMMRIHALALSYKDHVILLPTQPGGGKSTMALRLLQEDQVKLISDDEPVLDSQGYLRPFPIRIGTLNPDHIQHIPKQFIYHIDRMEFGLKYFVDCSYWQDSLEQRPIKIDKSILFVAPSTPQRGANHHTGVEADGTDHTDTGRRHWRGIVSGG